MSNELADVKAKFIRKNKEYNDLLTTINTLENEYAMLKEDIRRKRFKLDLYYWGAFLLIIILKNFILPQFSSEIAFICFPTLWTGYLVISSKLRQRVFKFEEQLKIEKGKREPLFQEVNELRELAHRLTKKEEISEPISEDLYKTVDVEYGEIDLCSDVEYDNYRTLSLTLNKRVK